ncbi:MAG: sensor histidine kinase [Hyphomonas sp.]
MMLRRPLRMALPKEFAGIHAEPMLEALLENSGDCIKLLDASGRLTYVNRNGLALLGLRAKEDILGRVWWDLWPEPGQGQVRDAVAKAASGEIAGFRGLCNTAMGVPKWWDVRVVPVTSKKGGEETFLVISRDVSEAAASRTMYETIALEMRHRLKNAFAVSSAIAKISARQRPEHQAFAEELVGRFSSLAVAQGKLVEEASSFSLRALVTDLVNAAGVGEETVDVSNLQDCEVDEMQMRVIAVVIGELTTNSLKYGALRAGAPVCCRGHVEDGALCVSWHEPLEGSPPIEANLPTSTGTGLKVIERIVASAGGQVERHLSDSELQVTFSLVYTGKPDATA